jgi:hypothetical protein
MYFCRAILVNCCLRTGKASLDCGNAVHESFLRAKGEPAGATITAILKIDRDRINRKVLKPSACLGAMVRAGGSQAPGRHSEPESELGWLLAHTKAASQPDMMSRSLPGAHGREAHDESPSESLEEQADEGLLPAAAVRCACACGLLPRRTLSASVAGTRASSAVGETLSVFNEACAPVPFVGEAEAAAAEAAEAAAAEAAAAAATAAAAAGESMEARVAIENENVRALVWLVSRRSVS